MSQNNRTTATEQANTFNEKSERYIPEGNSQQPVKTIDVLDLSEGTGNQPQRKVIVMKRWPDGTIYYIDPGHLDAIDGKRLTRAIKRAQANNKELWMVLQDTVLSNNRNGLDYFHQLTKTFKPEGAFEAPTADELSRKIKRNDEALVEKGGLSDVLGAPESSNPFFGG